MTKLTAVGKNLKNLMKRRPLNSSTEIRITHLCTQRCRQCSVYEKRNEPASMSLADFRTITRRLREYGANIGFISGGEATLVPDLDKMLVEAKKTFPLGTALVTGLINRTPIIEKFARVALENNIHIQTSLDGLGALGDSLRGAKNFAETVLEHMKHIADMRARSRSLLYANIVINNLNIEQVPELIRRARDLGWRATIGVYHALTATTRFDEELRLKNDQRLNKLIDFLVGNPDILNLDAFILGIPAFVKSHRSEICAFRDAPLLATRLTIMEDGNVHLCYGDPIGNLLRQSLGEIFSGEAYRQRIAEYGNCPGCWTTCYTQRYLLVHPRSFGELKHNVRKVLGLKKK
ncbi:radical SAM protein [candidate division KSB1 bacterium]|nr:radical SAM protein [candidate division KSB1 bacterium]